MKDINLNKVGKTTNNLRNNLSNKSAFDNTKAVYEGYVKKIEKSDFANSVSRYEIELNMLQSMKELAEKSNLTKEVELIDNKIQIAKSKLAEWGIKIKE